MYVVVLQCSNEYIGLNVSDLPWGWLAYAVRFETFNYGGGQRLVARGATGAEKTGRVGGLVWL